MALPPFSSGRPIPLPIAQGGTGSTTGQLVPTGNNSQTLGGTANYYSNLYATTLNLNSTASIDGSTAGYLDVTGTLQINSGSAFNFVSDGSNGVNFDGAGLGKNSFNLKQGSDGTFLLDNGGGLNVAFKMGDAAGANYIRFSDSSWNQKFQVNSDGTVDFSNKALLAASTITGASLNIPSGTAPTSPATGDIWNDGTYINSETPILSALADKGGQLYNAKAYGAKGDGATDDTAAIQAALDAAATAGGGIVLLPTAATYIVTNLTIDSYVTLRGVGLGTVLSAKTGTIGKMIALKTPASTTKIGIADLTIDGNYITGVYGIYFDNTGNTGSSRHRLSNVQVLNTGSDGIYGANSLGEVFLTDVRVYNALGWGINVQASWTDSEFTNIAVGACAAGGFNILGNDNSFVNCKSYWAGYNANTSTWGTTQVGWNLDGISYCHFSNCFSEQSALHGWDIVSCSRITLVACDASTNSAGTTGGVGFNTDTTTYSSLIGCTGDNNSVLSPGNQTYGIGVSNVQTGLYLIGNSVTGSSGEFLYNSGYGYLLISDSVVDFSGIQTKLSSSVQFTTSTTGSQSATLGSNGPMTTTTPYTWIEATASDGSTVYIPAWK